MDIAIAPKSAPLLPRRGRGRPRSTVAAVCPQHPGSVVYADRSDTNWSKFYTRPGWRCYPNGKGKPGSHRFLRGGQPTRHPTEHLPTFGCECPTCGKGYEVDEGPRSGRGFALTTDEAALCLKLIGQGESMRHSAQMTRKAAKRYMFVSEWEIEPRTRVKLRLLQTGKDRPRITDRYSKQSNLAAYYLDVLAPEIIDEFLPRKWPEVIVLDELPLRKPRFDDPDSDTGAQGGEEAGHVLCVVDGTTRPGKPISFWFAGGKNKTEWIRLFTRKDYDQSSAPSWIVCDNDPSIQAAVREVWPEATIYLCEGHLRTGAQKYAEADGIPEWVRRTDLDPEWFAKKQAAKAAASKSWKTPRDPDAEQLPTRLYERHPVWAAMQTMWRNIADWDEFRFAVATYIPDERMELRKWIADNELTILRQFKMRTQHPERPTGNGAVEKETTWLRDHFEERGGCFRNARRIQVVLDLMLLERAGFADTNVYSRLIAKHLKSTRNGGTGLRKEEWPLLMWDQDGSTIQEMIDRSDRERLEEYRIYQSHIHRERMSKLIKEDDERLVAAGLSPRGHAERSAPATTRAEQKTRRGLFVADYPELLAEWDYEANTELGLDPTTTRAASSKWAHWICRAHENDPVPHLHRWRVQVGHRTKGTGCRMCGGLEACPSTSVAAKLPTAAEEWATELNGDRTPDNTRAGAKYAVFWRCLRDPEHPPYRQVVYSHVLDKRRCPLHPEDRVATRRANADKRRQLKAAESHLLRHQLLSEEIEIRKLIEDARHKRTLARSEIIEKAERILDTARAAIDLASEMDDAAPDSS